MEAARLCTKGATDFVSYYESLCAIQSTYPVSSIRGYAGEGVLNCQIYKLKRVDWHPILTALRANRVLQAVAFCDKWEEKAQLYFNDTTCRARLPQRLINKTPDSEIINEIVRSLKPFLSNCQSVTSLLIEGIPLTVQHMKLLTKGLDKNHSLKHLSLKGSNIGDKGFIVLSQVLKHLYSLEWIDLTWCLLTAASMSLLADMIKYQSIHRQSSVWKDSLRGQNPFHSSLSGLRRITLNLNPEIKDTGAMKLIESLEDDIWIKALDMQTCGLTSVTAHHLQTVLKNNSGLVIVDLRENVLMDDDEIDFIIEELSRKATPQGISSDSYKYLDIELTRIKHELKTAGIPLHSKRTIKPSTKVHSNNSTVNKWCKRKGLPWRTAARSSQRWKNSISRHISSVISPKTDEILSSNSTVTTSTSTTSTSNESQSSTEHSVPIQVTLTLDQFRQLQNELTRCHKKLIEGEKYKQALKEKIKQLENENKLLKEDLEMKKSEEMHISRCSSLDDQTIQNIEATFKQFHSFLDLLNEKGYGHLTKNLLMTQ